MLMNQTNQTEDDGFSCYNSSIVNYRYFAVLWGCAVTITGSVGNLMTVLVFALNPRLRTRFNVLIVNLALTDFLYCTLLQPILVDTYLHLRWRSGQLWCSIFGLLLPLFHSVSIITLCLIAGGRYLLVTKRALFDRVFSNCGLSSLLISAWALGLATLAPLWSGYVFMPKMCACTMKRTLYHPYPTILLFFYFFVGLGFVGIFYLLIYKRVHITSQALLRYRSSHRSSRKKLASSAPVTDDSGIKSDTANTCSCVSSQAELTQTTDEVTLEKSTQSLHSFTMAKTEVESPPDITSSSPSPRPAPTNEGVKKMKHVTRMCLTVFLCFMLCFVPFLVLNIIDQHNRAPQVLHMFCANLTWLNSCINPILYAVMNSQFRQAYHALLTTATAPLTSLWTR